MRTTTILLAALLFFTQHSFGQHITLHARVRMQNSLLNQGKAVHISKTSLSAPYASPKLSDDSGRVALVFVGLSMGSSVAIAVDHPDFELVNTLDLQEVILGRLQPLTVCLAPRGQLAMAQADFYRIGKQALFERRDQLIAELKGSVLQSQATLRVLEAEYRQVLENRYEAEELTQEKVAELEEQLESMALELATVNLDFESEQYRKAFEQFRQGNLENVLTILDDSLLSRAVDAKVAALATLQAASIIDSAAVIQAQHALAQDVNSYSLKAKAQRLLLYFEAAAASQEKALAILQLKQFPKSNPQLAHAYRELGRTYQAQDRYEEAAQAQEKAIRQSEAYEELPIIRIDLYTEFSTSLLQTSRKEEALRWQNKGLDLGIKIWPSYHPRLGMMWAQVANMQLLTNAPGLALTAQKNAISILQAAPGVATNVLSGAFRLLGAIFAHKGDLVNAIKSVGDAIDTERKSPHLNKRELSAHYNELAKLHQKAGDLDKAIEAQESALRYISEDVENMHPQKAAALLELADLQNQAGKEALALQNTNKAITMLDSTLGKRSRIKGAFLQVLGDIQLGVGDSEHALATLNEALEIQLADSGIAPEQLAKSYQQLAEIQLRERNMDAAAEAQRKAIHVLDPKGNAQGERLAELYSKMALYQLRKGNLEASVEAHRRAIECLGNPSGTRTGDSDMRTYYENLGRVLFDFSPEEARQFAAEKTGTNNHR